MALLDIFKCPDCGYELHANKAGYDRFMIGWLGYYSCKKCRDVVTLQIPDIAIDEEGIHELYRVLGKILPCRCCGSRDLNPWGPKNKCPKCGGTMNPLGLDILAD